MTNTELCGHGPIIELSKKLTQSRSDLTAEKLAREDLECKLRLIAMHQWHHSVLMLCLVGPVSLRI